jgi:hypothetical protein
MQKILHLMIELNNVRIRHLFSSETNLCLTVAYCSGMISTIFPY